MTLYTYTIFVAPLQSTCILEAGKLLCKDSAIEWLANRNDLAEFTEFYHNKLQCSLAFEFLMHLHRNHGTCLFLFFTVAEPAQRVKYVTWDMACGATASVQASCYVIQNFKHRAMKQSAKAKQLVLASQYQKRGTKNTILQYIYMFAQLNSMVIQNAKRKSI